MGALSATTTIPHWKHGRQWYSRLGWTEQEFDARLREFYSGLFERYATGEGKKRWGEKTPFHSSHIEQMARVFPDAVFVAIVRHPGAVVHSLIRKFHHGVAEAAAYWEHTNSEILRLGAELGDNRFAMLRYEDLVVHSEVVLRELTGWLGESWSDDLLRHNDVQAEKGAPRISAGSTRTRDPIDAGLSDRWADSLTPPERAELVAITGALAGFLGYDAERPGTPAGIIPEAVGGPRFLVTGDVLAGMQRGQSGRLSFIARTRDDVLLEAEADATDLAKRLHQAERALTRMRSRRAVRWIETARRTQRSVTGLPGEVLGAARRRWRKH